MPDARGTGRPDGTVLGIDWQIGGFGAVIGAVAAVATALFAGAGWSTTALAAGGGALLGGLMGFLLARPLKRDLRDIAIYAAVLARGQWDARLPEEGTGELRYLMRQLSAMAASLTDQMDALRRLAEERAGLAQRAERLAILEERQRLARELHDTVSQELFAVAMLVGAIRQGLPEEFTDAKQKLVQAEEAARRAQATMRGLIRALRPVELGGQDLRSALAALLNEVQERHGIATELSAEERLGLPMAVEDALFRIAQEALSNAVRHGVPTHLRIQVEQGLAGAVLRVEDDGRGFDPAAAVAHVGLSSMHERAMEIGAQLRIQSQAGAGAVVEVRWTDRTVEKDDG